MKSKGFTLIEILVALGVMLTGTGLIVANYNTFNTSEKLRQSAKTLRNDLRFIQTRASSGLKPLGFTCSTLWGYRVRFTDVSYSYDARCAEGYSPSVTVALPKEISFEPIPSEIEFTVLTGKANTTTLIQLVGGGKAYHLLISASGDITDNGTQPILAVYPTVNPSPTRLPPTITPTYILQPTIGPATATPRPPTPTNTPRPPTPTNTLVPTPTPNWVFLCNEVNLCWFPVAGTKRVRYGKSPADSGRPWCGFIEKTFTNNVTCTLSSFGTSDPCPDVPKQCDYIP